MGRYCIFIDRGTVVNMFILPKVIHSLNGIPFKIAMAF